MATKSVSISASAYSPKSVAIKVGDTVEWSNAGTASAHTVKFSPAVVGVSDSGDIPPGGKYAATFMKAGTCQYACCHESTMTGSVVVS